MKRFVLILMVGILSLGFTGGCSSNNETSNNGEKEVVLDSKHSPFPPYITNTSDYIQETYVMAAEHHDALEVAPCYCNCYESAGHMSNRDCFIKEMGPDNEVLQWDPHGTA